MSTIEGHNHPEPFIFIAYHSSERSYATHLRKQLESLGFSVWWDQNVRSGEEWNEEISRKLREASCVVVLWSQRAYASDWIKHEASTAKALEKYAPCKIENVDVVGPLGRFQVRSLVGWDESSGTAEFPGLIESIEGLLGKSRNKDVTLATEFPRWPPIAPREWRDKVLALARTLSFALIVLFAFTISALTYRLVAKLQSAVTLIQAVTQQTKEAVDNQQARIDSLDVKTDYVIQQVHDKK